MIEKAEIFHLLTDNDSTALKCIFISGPNSDFPEKRFSNIIFEVIVTLKIHKRYSQIFRYFGCEKREQEKETRLL